MRLRGLRFSAPELLPLGTPIQTPAMRRLAAISSICPLASTLEDRIALPHPASLFPLSTFGRLTQAVATDLGPNSQPGEKRDTVASLKRSLAQVGRRNAQRTRRVTRAINRGSERRRLATELLQQIGGHIAAPARSRCL